MTSTAHGAGTPVDVPTDDGVTLAGRWFAPPEPLRAAAIIVPAMAAPARFYTAHATWLSSRGIGTLIFDYRGHAASQHTPIRAVDADAMRWAGDARDALRYVVSRAEGTPISWIGHSFGGQIMPFADHEKLSRIVTIGTGTGHWRLHPHPYLRAVLWTALAPALTRLCGYYPGARIRVVGDLPRNVMLQWAGWCRDRDYVVGARNAYLTFAQVTAPITEISFTDDELIPPRAVDDIHRWYTGSTITQLRFTPAQLGMKRVGHFGFFRSPVEPLWDELLLPQLPRADQP